MTYNYNWLEDSPAEMYDPTETYEAWKYREAEMQMEERKLDETEQKVFEYMEQYAPVNRSEIQWMAEKGCAYALWEDPDEYQLSYWEVLVAQEFADEYIKRNNIQFDEEWDIIDNPF